MKSPLTLYREANGSMSLESLANTFGVNKTTVMRWEDSGVPLDRLVEVSTKTGIPRHKLRPDLYEGFIPDPDNPSLSRPRPLSAAE